MSRSSTRTIRKSVLPPRHLRDLVPTAVALALLVAASSAGAVSVSGPTQVPLGSCTELRADGCPGSFGVDLAVQGRAYSCGDFSADRDLIRVVWDEPGAKTVRFECSICDSSGDCRSGGSASHTLTVPEPVVEITGPASGTVGEPLHFSASVENCDWSWDPNWDPRGFLWTTDDSGSLQGTNQLFSGGVSISWDTAGKKTVRAEKTKCGASDHAVVTLGGGTTGAPVILAVERELDGLFVGRPELSNRFRVRVAWNGAPGVVEVSVNREPWGIEDGDADGAVVPFRVGRDFPARPEPSMVELVAVNGEGERSPPAREEVHVFPLPSWLEEHEDRGYATLTHRSDGRFMVLELTDEVPVPHLAEDGPYEIPDWIPLVGGPAGLEETYAELEGRVVGHGTGRFRLFGQTGLVGLGHRIAGELRGGGTFRLRERDGLRLAAGYLRLDVEGRYTFDVNLVDAIPVIGKLIPDRAIPKPIADVVAISVSAEPFGGFAAGFTQDATGDLAFRSVDRAIGQSFTGTARAGYSSFLQASTWITGTLRTTVGLPGPFVRGWEAGLKAGARLDAHELFGFDGGVVRVHYACSYRAGEVVRCGKRETGAVSRHLPLRVAEIERDYERHGAASRLGAAALREAETTRAEAEGAPRALIANVFPGAEPELVGTPAGPLMLWLEQDASLPVAQSLDVAWSLRADGEWTEPARIATDRRTELSPSTARDGEGRAVAAWLRISDPDWTQPVRDVADLESYHRHLEVVAASFDPARRTWSDVVPLTADDAVDNPPRLTALDSGDILLTWLSNPGWEAPSTADSPSRLRYALWSASDAEWGPAGTVRSGLVGTTVHAAAAHRGGAFAVVERATGDGSRGLDLHRWDGEGWSAEPFARGTGDDVLPRAVTDSAGTGHVLWLRGRDLVHATLDDPTPRTVLDDEAPVGLLDAHLTAGDQGRLALVWPQSTGARPADLAVLVYDAEPDDWGRPRSLAEADGEAHDVSGYLAGDRLHLAFVHTELRRTDAEEVVEGVHSTVPDLSERGRSDLAWVERTLARDLAVEPDGLALEPRRPRPGGTARVHLEVRNCGDLTVEPFAITLHAGAPEDGGDLLAEHVTAEPLAAGGVVEIAFGAVSVPAGSELVAVVDPAAQIDEADESNNRASALLANEPPEVRIEPSTTAGPPPLEVTFEAVVEDPEGHPVSRSWLLAEGGPELSGSMVTHTFLRPGTHRVILAATDAHGAVGVDEVEVRVGGGGTEPCGDDPGALCLRDGRFEARMAWSEPGGDAGTGAAMPITDDTGYFWFFRPGNVEVVVKVLDACGVNGRLWVFAGGLTNLETTLTLRDTWTGALTTYRNPLGRSFRPVQDTAAFRTCDAPAPGRSATPLPGPASGATPTPRAAPATAACDGPGALCLGEGRYRVSAHWSTEGDEGGAGSAERLSDDTGYFWFFDRDNVEVLVKVLDACPVNDHRWVFAAGLTDVGVTLRVRDTVTGTERTYRNRDGVAFEPVQDTGAFAACP